MYRQLQEAEHERMGTFLEIIRALKRLSLNGYDLGEPFYTEERESYDFVEFEFYFHIITMLTKNGELKEHYLEEEEYKDFRLGVGSHSLPDLNDYFNDPDFDSCIGLFEVSEPNITMYLRHLCSSGLRDTQFSIALENVFYYNPNYWDWQAGYAESVIDYNNASIYLLSHNGFAFGHLFIDRWIKLKQYCKERMELICLEK